MLSCYTQCTKCLQLHNALHYFSSSTGTFKSVFHTRSYVIWSHDHYQPCACKHSNPMAASYKTASSIMITHTCSNARLVIILKLDMTVTIDCTHTLNTPLHLSKSAGTTTVPSTTLCRERKTCNTTSNMNYTHVKKSCY